VDKLTIKIGICDSQASGLTYLNMTLMLLATMLPGEELGEENELIDEI